MVAAVSLVPGMIALLTGCETPTGSVPLSSLEIDSVFPYVDVEQTLQLSVTAMDMDGEEVRNRIRWESRDSSLAMVADGLVRAGATPGVVTILATSGGLTDSLVLTIEPRVSTIRAGRSGYHAVPGRQIELEVEFGSAEHSARFASSDPTVASVSDAGILTTHAPGRAVVTITAGTSALDVVVVVRSAGYEATPLGTLGGPASMAYDINEGGQVVGTAQRPDGAWRAFLWQDGVMHELPPADFAYNAAVAINDKGVVVGTAAPSDRDCWLADCGPTQPWIWADGEWTPVSIESPANARFTDINNHDQVTGYTYAGWYRFSSGDAFVWQAGETTWLGKFGVPPPLQPTGTIRHAIASEINDDGLVAGSMTYYVDSRSIAWKDGVFSYVAPVGGSSLASVAVNDAGMIANSTPYGGLFVWQQGSITPLAPHISFSVDAIDSEGRIVGFAEGGGALWDGEYVVRLDDLLPPDSEYTVERTTGINDVGQIVGYGKHRTSGDTVALLLTPVNF